METKATPELARLRESVYIPRLKARVENLKRAIAEQKSGRVISAATKDKLKGLHDSLSAVMQDLQNLMDGNDLSADGGSVDSDGIQ